MSQREPASKIHSGMPPLARGLTIGLLGGSFNPPHEGHRHISLEAMRRIGLDRVWWLVTPGNPLKNNNGLPPIEERAAACAAIADHRRIAITTIEQQIGSSYTANTIEHLVRKARGANFVWLMGGDNLADFHNWDRWRDIAAMTPIAVLDRPGARHKALSSPAARFLAAHQVPPHAASALKLDAPPIWTYLDIPLSDTSSTALRNTSQSS